MNRFTKQQRFFIAAWFECFSSTVLVQRKFRAKFGLHASAPTDKTIRNIHKKAAEDGELEDEHRSGRSRSATSDEMLDHLRTSVSREPQKSVRRRSRELQVSKTSVQRMLKRDLGLYPYRPRLLQELSDEDRAHRAAFCEEMISILDNDFSFLDQLLFSDEAHFHLSGEVNRHNIRYWASSNPHQLLTAPLHSPRTTVWAAVWAGGVIGPFFHDETVTGLRYLSMLQEDVLPVLRTIDAFNEDQLFWQQDGAPPHFFKPAREWLNVHFQDRWIGRTGPIAWPPRSPDLTPCDFWLWGDMKRLVYRGEQPSSIDELKLRIRDAFDEISVDVRQSAIAEFDRRVRLCFQRNGDHIEHVL